MILSSHAMLIQAARHGILEMALIAKGSGPQMTDIFHKVRRSQNGYSIYLVAFFKVLTRDLNFTITF